ncbi:MAG TPA: trypsin-like peptidase domain-containing protein [Beutenbergiaceae bacterium]|nr:trypsin-like peptidase domain-containing protein [Beutenbergiaceae bacterium]
MSTPHEPSSGPIEPPHGSGADQGPAPDLPQDGAAQHPAEGAAQHPAGQVAGTDSSAAQAGPAVPVQPAERWPTWADPSGRSGYPGGHQDAAGWAPGGYPPGPGSGADAGQGGYYSGQGNPYGSAGAPPPAKQRTRTPWLAIGAAALLAAALASGGTAALMQQQADEPASSEQRADDPDAQVDPVPPATDGGADWEAVAQAVRPTVVAIDVAAQGGAGAGSGLVWDADGHIVTNNHVIDGAAQIQVTLSDGRMFAAEVVGTDPVTDLAVLALVDPPEDLELAGMGQDADRRVGEPVMAVGNPLGLSSTVTTGVVSALDRPVTAGEGPGQAPSVTNAIQVDAAVNPGNSGGPLFDAEGQVIGINSSIAALSGGQSGSIGLGFAIPADLVVNITDQLIANGEAEHAFLGVAMTDDTATVDDITRTGASVQTIEPGSPAAEADIDEGDVITAIDDRPVASAAALTGYVRTHTAGDEVTLSVVRDGEALEVSVTLATTSEQIA